MDGPGTFETGWPAAATGSLVVLASYGIGWTVGRISMAIGLRRTRRSADADWVERARLTFPVRRMVAIDVIYVPALLCAAIGLGIAPRLGLAPTAWGLLGGLASMLGVLAVVDDLERRICGPAMLGTDRQPGVSLFWIMWIPALVPFGFTMALMPSRWGWSAAGVLAAGLAATTFHIAGGWLIPLRWLGMVRYASPRLEVIIDRAVDRVGVRTRASFELASHTANALAWPVPKLLVFTGPILDRLDDDQLVAITAHELGHLDEPWAVYLTRIVSSYLLVITTTFHPLSVSFGLLAGLAPLALMLVLIFVMKRVGRNMEERSDRLGREHEGDDVGTYARALESIHRANLMPAVMRGKRNVHPNLYDRMVAAGVTPDYTRPEPPPRAGLAAIPTLILAVIVIGFVVNSLPKDAVEPTENARNIGRQKER